ncbi:MAG TPA: deoxyguanosinetriphosphate triphosphohydrolase [Chthoniobacteraceae bacterium]|nr:deoxyguanosinetriphosphate triphosphohydrolase [Chthoniobacteraceae bacterium]
MQRTREELEELESATLAPYAQKSRDSAGRKHREPRHPYRTEYQRDRERIVHSRAFRRLEYKTQVFLNGTGDHLRTRLTHTIEVASISRSIARALALNEDLAEAIALAHDLGHAPFGHSGEAMLDGLMRGEGGFEHNAQSLRIVEMIEKKYPGFAGLNLSAEVLEGMRKHQKFHELPGARGAYTCPSLEAQIANLADEITYYSHDIDDGLDFDLITLKQLGEMEIWQESYEMARAQFPKLKGMELTTDVIRRIIDRQVEDVIVTSFEVIAAAGVRTADEARMQKKPLIRYSAPRVKANRQLRKFLYANLYYHPRVSGVNQRACVMLKNVFKAYMEKPSLLGATAARRVRKEGLARTVCDYLSGMTDRYLLEEHGRLFPGEVLTAGGRR